VFKLQYLILNTW